MDSVVGFAGAQAVWLVICAAFIFFMQAGFAMLESGMVRSKNTVNVLMKNYVDLGFGSLAFWMIGYGLMFGANPSGWFGTDRFFFQGVDDSEFIQLLVQIMFAATSATIVSGALAERIRYWSYVVSAVVVSTLIYATYGSWAWGGTAESPGWLRKLGFVDVAGSSVVHSVGGWCALAGVIVLGSRLGRYSAAGKPRSIPGHNLPLVALGGLILWMGWFAFNGSSVALDEGIGRAVLNTHLAGCSGLASAVLLMAVLRKPILMTTTINGALGGMVAICAGCSRYEPQYAIIVGLVAGLLVVLGMDALDQLRLDDAVGAVAVHGVCGAWGTVCVGLFGSDRLFDFGQVGVQLIGVVAAFIWAFPTAWLLFFCLDKVMGLRATTTHEQRGLDFTEHKEIGYPEFQDILHPDMD